MASSSSSHAAPTFSSRSFKYDVFLSFRGEDTRKTFVDHLYSALRGRLIGTYKDDETLPRGDSIRPSLFMAIEESRIALIIFSKNYADSSWCLDELSHIMKCQQDKELIVMPIFYDVDPSDVRKQKGDFGKAFDKLEVENINKAQVWRNALVDASNIAGWEPKYIANGHESQVIKEIVDTIWDMVSSSDLQANEDLVGMTTRLQYLKPRLGIGSDGVRMVGIWGVGGGGKTTLASSLFVEISRYFEGNHTIENIREESSKYGIKKLQENILSAFSPKEVEVHDIFQGKRMIQNMLSRKKVLVLLDDVDDVDQLEALAGSHDWFGSGSRIIITTRNEHLLRTHKVDEICHVRLLSDDEAMRLFNRHAYNEKVHIEDYETLSLRVVSYAAGLPLALKILGSFLYDKEKEGWISTLDRLKDIPETKIVEKLKVSYDGLKNIEKELFLDIACFFRGEEKEKSMEALEACGYHPEIGIQVLRQKALISIVDAKFDMHDLVQEMGHYIVRGEHPNNPDKHSRIWKCEDINSMHFGDATMGNDKIEAIDYRSNVDRSAICKIVSNIKNLRYLRVDTGYRKEDEPIFLSNGLRYFEWSGYLTRSLILDGVQSMKLVVLTLHRSLQKEIWKGCKHLPHLKALELCWMYELVRTPNFDELPSLQKLIVKGCFKLKEIHPSLENRTTLQYVEVTSCSLRKFPTISHMKNLKDLRIHYCGKIVEFPKIQANMESLVNLSITDTGIKVLPSSFLERCTNLISLRLSSFKNSKSIQINFQALKHLQEISHVKRRHDQFPPSSIIELSNLQELDLSSNYFSRLDFRLSQLIRLKLLNVSNCEKLLELPELPSSLSILNASGCKSLTGLGDCYNNCRWLSQVSVARGSYMFRRESILKDGDRLLEFMLEVCMAIENHYMLLQLYGVGNIAKEFTPSLVRGKSCTLQLPEKWCNDYSGFLMCAVMPFDCIDYEVRIDMNGLDGEQEQEHDVFWEESHGNRDTWMVYVSFGLLRQTKWWDQTYKAISFKIGCSWNDGYGFGVRLFDKKTPSTNHSSSAALKIISDSTSALTIEVQEGPPLWG